MRQSAPRSPQTLDPMIWLTIACVFTVLLLHHPNYTKDYLWEVTHRFFHPYSLGIDKILQQFAVGGFFLMSGFKLTKSKCQEPAWEFLRGRLLRIYPMYFVTIVLFSFTSYPYLQKTLPSVANFVVHALCLQALIPNVVQANFHTIWFVSNLICYYGLFLLLRRWITRPKTFLIGSGLVVAAVSALNWLPVPPDKTLIIQGSDCYLVYFAVGMLYAQYTKQFERLTLWGAGALMGINGTALLFSTAQTQGLFKGDNVGIVLLQSVLSIAAVLPLHFAILKVTKSIPVAPLVAGVMKQMTFASFGIFLLHRPVWSVMANIWSGNTYLHSGYMLGLGFPLIFLLSYGLQSSYNKGLRWYLDRQKLKAQTN